MKKYLMFLLWAVATAVSGQTLEPHRYMESGSSTWFIHKKVWNFGTLSWDYKYWKYENLAQSSSPQKLTWTMRTYEESTGVTIQEVYNFQREFNPDGTPRDWWNSYDGHTVTSTTWVPGSGQPFGGTTNYFSSPDHPYYSRAGVPFNCGQKQWETEKYRWSVSECGYMKLVNSSDSTHVLWKQWFHLKPGQMPFTYQETCVGPLSSAIVAPKMWTGTISYPWVGVEAIERQFQGSCP